MNIPDSNIIIDNRSSKDFKGITKSGYKRTDVIKAYLNSMINNKLEDSIRWCVELHSTGLNKAIWDNIYQVYFRYIHINNPKLFFYILKREKDYFVAINKYPRKHESFSRNDQEIRNLYAELTAISCLTKKNNMFLPKSLPTINDKSFLKEYIAKRIISKNLNKLLEFINHTTTNEMKIALNEIINNLALENGTFENCIYWYLWLEKYQTINNKNNKNILIKLGNDEDHWIFILWNIILSFDKLIYKNDNIFLKKLHYIYKKNFKLSEINKKKFYIFIAFYILKKNINWNINIFSQEYLIIQTNANINIMYENIKNSIESKLSNDGKNNLYKNYFIMLNREMSNEINRKIIPNKVKDTYLDENVNKVLFTKYPDYININNQNNEMIREDTKDKLISRNMTLRNIEEEKELQKDKKISAFVNFISFKNNKYDNSDNDEDYKKDYQEKKYENQENLIKFKNINFSNKK